MFLKNMYIKHKKRKEFVDSIYKLEVIDKIKSYEELCEFYDKFQNFVKKNKDYLINISDNMSRSQRIELGKRFDMVMTNYIKAIKESNQTLTNAIKSVGISDESKLKTLKYLESQITTSISAVELMSTISNLLKQ